tara:strand:- start:6473 stop:6958 length:486 start_codon:yes stop_codon:yes gene_type:complete
MVTSTGCSIKEAFNLPKKNKKISETYEENGRILEHLQPLEEENKVKRKKEEKVEKEDTEKVPTSVSISDSNYVKVDSKQTDKLTEADKRALKISQNTNTSIQSTDNINYEKYKHRQKERATYSESFSNFNDDFNDVLLFALLGFFYLIFTDYVYKLGKRSY